MTQPNTPEEEAAEEDELRGNDVTVVTTGALSVAIVVGVVLSPTSAEYEPDLTSAELVPLVPLDRVNVDAAAVGVVVAELVIAIFDGAGVAAIPLVILATRAALNST